MDDIEFFLRGLFGGHIGMPKAKQNTSFLAGPSRLDEVGDYGDLKASGEDKITLKIKDGAKTERDVLRVDLSAVYLGTDSEFCSLLRG